MLRGWQRTLHSGRWVGINWPVEYGGRGASLTQVAVYNEELARANAPQILGRGGVSLVGPTLMAHGTEEQRRQWMPRILAGDDVWCQLFSEPDAGSDLAALSTRAEKRGGVYRRDGPEGVVVVRRASPTGASRSCGRTRRHAAQRDLDAGDPDDRDGRGGPPAAPDHRRERVQRGVLRRRRGPGRATSSDPEHEGWRVANTTLANERGAIVRVEGAGAARGGHRRAVEGLCTWRGGSAIRSPASGSRRRGSRSRSSASTTSGRWRRLARGEELGPESSLVKLFWAGMSQRLARDGRGGARARRAADAGRRPRLSTRDGGRSGCSRRAPTRSWAARARSSATSSASGCWACRGSRGQ